MRIGVDAGVARQAMLADIDHRAPLGELGAEPAIFGEPLAKPVEAFGDHFARAVRQRLDALVDLDAGQRARLRDQLDQRRAVLGVLANGLVIEDDAGNIFGHRLLGAEQHFAIVAPGVGGRFHAERIEALLDGAGGFVGGQNAAAGGDHGLRHLVQFAEIHRRLPNVRRRDSAACLTLFYAPVAAEVSRTNSTFTPGRVLPSSDSRNAPPAVETWLRRPMTPATLSAATVSLNVAGVMGRLRDR